MKAGHMIHPPKVNLVTHPSTRPLAPTTMAHILLVSKKNTKEPIMKPGDIKKAIESLQQFLLDEYGLDTKASSSKQGEQPSSSELNAIFGNELLKVHYDKHHKAANRS